VASPRLVWPVWLLVSCSAGSFPAAEHREAYRRIASDPHPDPDRDLERCAALPDDLAGDCGLVVAHRAGVVAGDPARWCDEVRGGVWREECHFQAAELRRRQHGVEQAIELCDRSGRFRDSCLFHLWQEPITRAHREAPGLEQAAAAVEADWRRWQAHVDESVFWTRFYTQHFEPQRRPDVADCTGPRQRDCRAGLLDVVRRRAIDWVRRGGRCAGLPDDPEAAAAWWGERGVRFATDPEVVAALAMACVEAERGARAP